MTKQTKSKSTKKAPKKPPSVTDNIHKWLTGGKRIKDLINPPKKKK